MTLTPGGYTHVHDAYKAHPSEAVERAEPIPPEQQNRRRQTNAVGPHRRRLPLPPEALPP